MHAEQLDWAGPKIIEGMSNEEYHARPELSSSQLKIINKSVTKINPMPQTDCLKLGNLVHALALEPEEVENQYFSYATFFSIPYFFVIELKIKSALYVNVFLGLFLKHTIVLVVLGLEMLYV